MAPRKQATPKPGEEYYGDGIYGPKRPPEPNYFGKKNKRDISNAEFSRYAEDAWKGLSATMKQYELLNPGKRAGIDVSGPGVGARLFDNKGNTIKAMHPSKARAIITGRRVAARAESARTNKATTRKTGAKKKAY
jgi:hypothetical protein